MNTVILVEMIVYCLVMLSVGYYFVRKEMTQSDYLLGGHKLPGWALAFSERATGESAWLLLGATGFAFSTGLSSIWVFVGIPIGIIVSWIFLAKRFMRETQRTGVLTIPDYLAVRFGKHAKWIRWLSGLLIIYFFMFYLGAQFAGAGKTLSSTFGFSVTGGILLCAAIVVIYSCMGGFFSVVWTDVIQSFLMIITLVILPIIALIHIYHSGLSIHDSLVSGGSDFSSWTGGAVGAAIGVLIVNNFSWFFGYMGGQPQLSSRFMALKNVKEANTGRNVAIIWTILAYAGAFAIGICAIALYKQGQFSDVEMVLPQMITDLLPSWIGGILLAGILAAIMSTASSQLLVLTSSVSEDIAHKALGLTLSDKALVRLSRLTVILAGVVGTVIALVSDSLVYTVVSWAWAGIGNTFSVAILLTFFWKRTSGIGIIATILSGFVSTIIWISTPLDTMLTSRFSTFVIALIFGVIFSLLFPGRSEKDISEVTTV